MNARAAGLEGLESPADMDDEEWAGHLGAGLILCCFGKYEEALSSLVRCHQLALRCGSQSQCRVDVAARALCEAVGEICKQPKGLGKAYAVMTPCFQRYNSSSRSARAWSALFVGWALFVSERECESSMCTCDEQLRWLKRSLDIAARSPDNLIHIECSANHLLFCITPRQEWRTQLHHLKMWREAAARWGELHQEIYALYQHGFVCFKNDEFDEAVRSRNELGELVKNSEDASLQCLSECLSGWIAFEFGQKKECLGYAMRVISRLQVPRRLAEFTTWSSYFSSGFKAGNQTSSPTRDYWLLRSLDSALSVIVFAHRARESEIVLALAALAKYKQVKKVLSLFQFDSVVTTERLKLWHMSRFCKINLKLAQLKGEKWYDRAESAVAKTLRFSLAQGSWHHYIETLSKVVTLAEEMRTDDDDRFYFDHSEDRGHFEMIDSFLAEAESLARQHWPMYLFSLSSRRAYFMFRMQDMDEEVIKILEPLGRDLLERSYNLGSFSKDRIVYSEWGSDTFEMLQAALVSCQQPDRALLWAERERAQDLLHNIKMNQSTAQAFREMEFNLDDAKALEEVSSIIRDAQDEETAFLVYTTVYKRRGICGFLLHHTQRKAWFKKLEPPLEISADVQKITERVQCKLHKDCEEWALERLREWYKLLISPVEAELEKLEAKKLVIIPGKSLSGLPFAALYKGPGEPFLVEKFAVSCVPSLRMYAHCKHRGETLMERNHNTAAAAVVIGNPTSALANDLPHAEEEAQATKVLMQNAGIFQDIKLLRRDQATKSAVLESLPAADWVHYAGHAVVSSKFPHGALLLASESSPQPATRKAPPNPSTLNSEEDSHVKSRRMRLLRYAEERPSSEMLTGDEIQSGKMEVRALVTVLSACQSGLGEAVSEGVLGMYRALHVAGAPSVVCSLWNLDDECTKSFMRRLYEKLVEGSELVVALQEVMVEFIDDGSPVQDWAAFIISGNPGMKMRTKPGLVE